VEADPSGGRTFIISGLGRGGTSMVAKVLREAGLVIGERLADLVDEDLEMFDILRSGNSDHLDEIIIKRNASHSDWGFKLGNIDAYLRYADIARFRNPRLIVIFRDPVAIAVRSALAEYYEPLAALQGTSAALAGLIEFINRTTCPSLLLSYEKALIFPEAFIDTLLTYCDISVSDEARSRLLNFVQPNAEAYVNGARREFAGVIEVLRDDVLLGWGCQLGQLSPVDLDLFVDGYKASTFKANQPRPDLAAAGYGNGNHGFSVDLSGLSSHQTARLQVRISGRTFELRNSGRMLSEYRPPL
jgi:hypothetical protein